MPSAVGGLVGGLFGAKTPKPPNVQTFQPTDTAGMDALYQKILNTSAGSNPYATNAPAAQATFNAQYNNPNAAGYQTAANNAGTAYGTTGTQAVKNAATIGGTVAPGVDAALQTLNLGFDPQNALYARTLQQLTDQTNANQAARGITNSPYGASVANKATSDFNIDWQNQQLTRALQALSGYTSGVAGAGQAGTTAENLGTSGAAALNNAGAVPFAATNTIANNQSAALNQLLQVLGVSGSEAYSSQNLADIMQYLNLGANQANQQGQFDLQNYANKLAAAQASQGGLGGLTSSLLTSGANLATTPGAFDSLSGFISAAALA